MKNKDKVWNKEKKWFNFKFSFVFLALGFLCTILMILDLTIWDKNPIVCIILIFFELVFYSIFFAPIIKELYV